MNIVINGPAQAGKTTFVTFCIEHAAGSVCEVSYATPAKIAARKIPYIRPDGKSARYREFIHALTVALERYDDLPFKHITTFQQTYNHICRFIHIREPRVIARAVQELDALAIFIDRPIRDGGYDCAVDTTEATALYGGYDKIIKNTGSLRDLETEAVVFLKEIDCYKR